MPPGIVAVESHGLPNFAHLPDAARHPDTAGHQGAAHSLDAAHSRDVAFRPDAALHPDFGLLPAEIEAADARKMGPLRRREFAAVRCCARRALLTLDVPPGPILPGERGSPTWPPGIVGSMTHTANYVAAAVAPATAIQSLGIDAEPHRPLPHGMIRLVATPADKELLASLPSTLHWDRILFSAKESVYKWWFPLTHRWLGFRQVTLALRLDGTFTALLPADAPTPAVIGSWAVRNDLIVTAVATTPQPGPAR